VLVPSDLSVEDTEVEKCVVYRTTVEYTAVRYSQDSEGPGDCLNNGADETIYEDCQMPTAAGVTMKKTRG